MFSPEYDPAYDPVEHLDLMKIRLVRHTLGDHNALWIPERQMVIVDRHLRSDLLRPTLAHECDHAEKQDCGGHDPRNEARANLNSGLRLINPTLWDELTPIVSDYDEICLELGVTRRQFRAYYEDRRRKDSSSPQMERIGKNVYIGPKMGAGQWTRKVEVA